MVDRVETPISLGGVRSLRQTAIATVCISGAPAGESLWRRPRQGFGGLEIPEPDLIASRGRAMGFAAQ